MKPRTLDDYMPKTIVWTRHAMEKMRFYRLTESRVKRIIRHPERVEEGVLENGIACMQVAGGKNYSEIWSMYVMEKGDGEDKPSQIKVITAWRYPGKSPARDPIPQNVMREIHALLNSFS